MIIPVYVLLHCMICFAGVADVGVDGDDIASVPHIPVEVVVVWGVGRSCRIVAVADHTLQVSRRHGEVLVPLTRGVVSWLQGVRGALQSDQLSSVCTFPPKHSINLNHGDKSKKPK